MIDIIIPVYNTPLNDLERCLNSILNQTYKKYKVYIIDDGSNYETKSFLDEYVKDKSNFLVKHIINSGVSNARNVGIDISNNKYITFVDSDDTLEKDFLKESFKLIENNNLDLIIGGYNEIRNNQVSKTRLCLPGLHIYNESNLNLFFEKLLSSRTNKYNKEIGDCPTGRIYTRLFRRESIGNLKFDINVHISEDTLFMIDYMHNNPIIGIVDKVWYNYYINNYSISNSTNKDKLINNINDFILEIDKRKKNEKDNRIKEAYQVRVNKAKEYIDSMELK